MAHECEICGQHCACDGDDTGGLTQPNDCPHFAWHEAPYLEDSYYDDDDDDDDWPFDESGVLKN